MTVILKICKKHGELTQEFVALRKRKNYQFFECRLCARDNAKRATAKYLKTEKYKGWSKTRMRRLTEAGKTYRQNHRIKARNELHTEYVKKIIKGNSNLSHRDIPPELVEAKRIQLQLKRKLRELKNVDNQC